MKRFAPLSEGSKTLNAEYGPEPETVAEEIFKTLGCY